MSQRHASDEFRYRLWAQQAADPRLQRWSSLLGKLDLDAAVNAQRQLAIICPDAGLRAELAALAKLRRDLEALPATVLSGATLGERRWQARLEQHWVDQYAREICCMLS